MNQLACVDRRFRVVRQNALHELRKGGLLLRAGRRGLATGLKFGWIGDIRSAECREGVDVVRLSTTSSQNILLTRSALLAVLRREPPPTGFQVARELHLHGLDEARHLYVVGALEKHQRRYNAREEKQQKGGDAVDQR